MDFLGLRNLTILDDALRNIEANRGRSRRPRRAEQGPRRPADLRAARPRRHPRRLPVRRRPDALAAAADEAGQLRGHLRGRRALPARPDGRRVAHQLRAAQERPASRSRRSTPSSPQRSRTSWATTYGLIVYQEQVIADRPEARRLHARQGRPAAQGDGQEEARGARRGVRRLLRGHDGQRLLDGGHQDAVGHPGPVLRLRVQQGALRGVRPGLLLDGLPQGQLPGRVHGRAADQRARTTRTSRRSTSTSAAGWASRCCRRTSTSRTPTSPRVGTDIRFGLSAIRNVGENVVAVDRGDPRGQGPVHRLLRLPAQGRPCRPATRRPSSR